MLKLSTKGRYGTRLMLDLALESGNGPILLKDIAKRQDISEGYLEHIIRSLKVAGLIVSNRGAHGGYRLTKEPSQITLKTIIEALEGPVTPSECVSTPSICQRSCSCTSHDIWKELEEKFSDILNKITLQHMVEKENQKRGQN